jgi:hypothetical protein
VTRRALPFALLALVVLAPIVGGAAGELAVLSPLCHQDPARSIALGSAVLPLCARCTGVLAGVALVALTGSRALGDRRAWPLLVALGALDPFLRPLSLDHAIERALLGAVLGAGLALGAAWLCDAGRRLAPRARRLATR